MRNWLATLFAAAFAFCSVSSPLCAAEPARPRVLVWSESARDQELVERVRGQVSDLELDLVPVEAKPAGGVDSGVVLVWFTRPDPQADRVVVHALRGTEGKVWQRELGSGGAPALGGGLSSATQEAAALVVREALRDMIRDDLPAPEPQSETRAPVPKEVVARVVERPKPERSVLSLRAELRWELVEDGRSLLGREGPAFRLSAAYRALELSLFASSSLPVAEQDARGKLRLLRQAAGVRAGSEWKLSRTATLDLGLRAGLASYRRSVVELAPRVTPNADRVSVSVLVGPELRLCWAPFAGPLELTLAGGVDIVPGAPRIGYQVDGRFEPSFSVWRLQPLLGIGLAFSSSSAR